MKRIIALLAVVCLCTMAFWVVQTESKDVEWSVKAGYTDACCCKPSCPCLFGSAPTLGFCEGVSLVELEKAKYDGVNLDGVKVAAVYRGKSWIKFYVSEDASAEQTEAAAKLLPTFEEFFAIDNVVEVKNVPISVERKDDWMKIALPNTVVEIEVMKGKNGKPIKIENLPWPGFPAPPLNDHTQYKTIVLKHDGGEQRYEHSETNGFTAKIEADSKAGH